MKKKQKGKEGNAVHYTTRNQALNRLQIKLPEFRRLCILKGIHPREPKKKVHGQNKTYYHVKDINFLLHEPLLDKGRQLKAHQKKIKKARAKLDEALAERLEKNKPEYSLDHLVRERYPSFIDALRDLDDALTMLHLFATLPADNKHKIPVKRVQSAQRLSFEWQAYVTKTHALRKTFVSVKGIYYQAEVWGQKVTWLVPHALSQILPPDVDFRVMLTFLEFYETLMGFVNFKLYHSLGLKYPPVLDPKLEEAAQGLSAVMASLRKDAPEEEAEVEEAAGAKPDEEMDEAGPDVEEKLAELKDKLAAAAKQEEAPAVAGSSGMESDKEEGAVEEEDEDEESRLAGELFKGLVFFLAREVPRESLLFVLRAFGATVSWEGDGAPFPENDESITHQVVDRPTQGHKFLSREYVQPQWVYDSINTRLLLPTEDYVPGSAPPPHLSPFVDHEAEGYLPEYGEQIQRLREAAGGRSGVLPLPGAEELSEGALATAAAAERGVEAAAAARLAEAEAAEAEYARELSKELQGVPYSASLAAPKEENAQEGEEEEESEEEAAPPRSKVTAAATEADDEAAMAHIMMPRKTKKLYQAMQMGLEKKRAHVENLEKKRKMLSEGGKSATKKKKKKSA